VGPGVTHPLKGPCQEEKLILCEKIYFLAKLQCWVTSISTFTETSFHFWCQSLLHQSPIRIKVFGALWSHGDKIKVAELRDPQDLAAEPPDSIQTLSAKADQKIFGSRPCPNVYRSRGY